jgi:hypothetical protein
MTVEDCSEGIWPNIPTKETKHRCLIEFKTAMCNEIVDQVVCVICACLHYKSEGLEINIGKIPSQELLQPKDPMHPCINHVDVEIDSNTTNVQMSG